MDPDEYNFGADLDLWEQYDDFGNQGVDPALQSDGQQLAGLDAAITEARDKLNKAKDALDKIDANYDFSPSAYARRETAVKVFTAAEAALKSLESARATGLRMLDPRQDSSGYQVLSKGNGMIQVYNKRTGKVENLVDYTAKQGSGTVRQVGNRLIRENPDGSFTEVYQAPPSAQSYSPASMMQAEEQRESGRFERETKFPFEQDKWQQGQDNWQMDFAEKQKQRDLDEAWRAAQRADASQRDAVNLFGTTAQSFAQNLPYAAIPGQSHFLGFEPGGVWEGVAKSRGVPFDPARFQAPVQQYDPNEAWRQAQAMRRE